MEGIYQVDNDTRVAIFSNQNDIVAMTMEGTKNARWKYVSRDYMDFLTCEVFNEKLYVAYLSVDKEIILLNVGNSDKAVLINSEQIIGEICYMRLFVLKGQFLLIIGVSAEENEKSNNWTFYIHFVDKNKIEKINTISCGSVQGEIYQKNQFFMIFFEKNEENETEILKIDMKKDEQPEIKCLYICNKKVIFDLKQETEELRIAYEQKIEKLINDKKLECEKLVKTVQEGCNEQYEALKKLAVNIQNEGKMWRDKYYKSVKKKENKT